jgi:hypothetical protein
MVAAGVLVPVTVVAAGVLVPVLAEAMVAEWAAVLAEAMVAEWAAVPVADLAAVPVAAAGNTVSFTKASCIHTWREPQYGSLQL